MKKENWRERSPNPEDRMSARDEAIKIYKDRMLYRSAFLHGVLNSWECGSMKKVGKYLDEVRGTTREENKKDWHTIDRLLRHGEEPDYDS